MPDPSASHPIRFCRYCGTPRATTDAKFCIKCGQTMTTKEAFSPAPSPEDFGMSQEEYKEALDAAAKWMLETSIKMLQEDPDAEKRAEGARALGALQEPAAVEPLIASLATEKEWEVKKDIIDALGQLRDERAVASLRELQRTETEPDRLRTIEWALARILW